MNDNTKLFIKTIDRLAMCQGSYSRMSRDIHNAIENDSSMINELNNSLPEFYDMLDVVFYLEQ